MSAEKTRKNTKKAFAKRRPGFSLVENLMALIILVVAILASFQTIAFALLVTTEARGRMKSYAQLEQAGLASASDESVPTAVPPVTVAQDNVQVQVFIEGDGTPKSVEIRQFAYKYTPNAFPSQKMKSPVVVVFRAK
jgi:Tfp pilus assembly protein FimT